MLFAVAAPREGLELIDFVGVIVYLLVTASIVYWSSRRQKTTEDFFLGGRRMPWMAVGMSVLATLMSSISYMGLPGEMLSHGVAMFYQYLSLPFSMLVVLTVWMPFFMRLRVTNAYDYLELRFDRRVRLLGATLFLLLRLGWMSMVIYVGSLALTGMTASLVPADRGDVVAAWIGGSGTLLRDTLLYWIIVFVGVTATIYTYAGGFRAAIWNDVLQTIMLLGGALVTLGYVVLTTRTGPLDWWAIASERTQAHTQPELFSFDPTVRMTVFTAVLLSFFWTICTHGSDQVVLQRYFSTVSLRAARRSYIVNALTDVTMGALLALCGLALLAFYLQNPTYLPEGILENAKGGVVVHQGDRILPYFFAHQLPAGVGGVVLAVLLCDAMQTLVSGVNSISAVFTNDVLAHLGAPERRMGSLHLARVLTLIVGVVVTGVAVGVAYQAQHSERNIIDMMAPAFNMFLGPLASLFLIGMFLKCGPSTTLTAALCSLVISFLWSYWQVLFGTDYLPSITLSTGVPYLSSFVIAAVLSVCVDRGTEYPGLAYTRRAVLRGMEPAGSEVAD